MAMLIDKLLISLVLNVTCDFYISQWYKTDFLSNNFYKNYLQKKNSLGLDCVERPLIFIII